MINWFNFNSKDSRDVGIIVKRKNSLDIPERDLEYVPVPGRNGDLIFDNGRWKNISVDYDCRIFSPGAVEGLNENLPMTYTRHDLSDMLHGDATYYRLFDSYDPDYFRLAIYAGGVNFDELAHVSVMDCKVNFNCKPMRYRWDGLQTITRTYNGSSSLDYIINPEKFPSKPIIRMYATTDNAQVAVSIANENIIVNNVDGYVEYDAETQNCYKGATNMNNNCFATFEQLKPGINTVTVLTNIAKIEVIPRWCRI